MSSLRGLTMFSSDTSFTDVYTKTHSADLKLLLLLLLLDCCRAVALLLFSWFCFAAVLLLGCC